MAQLISMRQRIKTVETIKKITHAMRLISMSTHSRLRHKKQHLEVYKNAFQALWSRVQSMMTTSEQQASNNHLIILVGSQKGLCGTFNNTLFRFFEHDMPNKDSNHHIVAVGKYAIDFCKLTHRTPLAAYDNFSVTQFVPIAQAIIEMVINSPISYASVVVYSNYQKNFFVQKSKKSTIYPIEEPATSEPESQVEYLFEQSPEELSTTIRQLMLTVSLEEILFDSLLAEQAARFISMDNSTRNADKLLVSMKLEYNKSRQAAITRELTELSTSAD